MGKRIFVSILWGLAVWTWVSMAHFFVGGMPDIGLLTGVVTAAAVVSRGLAAAPLRRRTGLDKQPDHAHP